MYLPLSDIIIIVYHFIVITVEVFCIYLKRGLTWGLTDGWMLRYVRTNTKFTGLAHDSMIAPCTVLHVLGPYRAVVYGIPGANIKNKKL